MNDEDISEVVIVQDGEDSAVVVQEEEETAVIDNGQTYESTESAIIAKEEADRAKLWAQESERQANLATESANNAVDARDDAIEVKEYVEDKYEILSPILDKIDTIRFGMYKYNFVEANWTLSGGKYYIDFDKNIVNGVYKNNDNTSELMTNIDVVSLANGVRIYAQSAFDGYALLVNSATPETYIYEQGVASAEWEIKHNLNRYPSVTIVDSSGNVFHPAVQYVDENTCIIMMNGATTGKAYLN